MSGANFSDFSLLELFQMEIRTQGLVLNDGLLALERNAGDAKVLEALMRAAHSIKGAARIVQVEMAVSLAHAIEDCFVAAQARQITLAADEIDILLQGTDQLHQIATDCLNAASLNQPISGLRELEASTRSLTASIAQIANSATKEKVPSLAQQVIPQNRSISSRESEPDVSLANGLEKPEVLDHFPKSPTASSTQTQIRPTANPSPTNTSQNRTLRVSAENLNQLMGLAGESLVEANWLQPFSDSLTQLKNRQAELSTLLEKIQEQCVGHQIDLQLTDQLRLARQKASECREFLSDRQTELEQFSRRSVNLSDRLYRQVIAIHMRPFAEGGQGFPRMVRDLSRELGKQVKLEILGKSTLVDRDILEKLETPLMHSLRNAIDHGIELPEERLQAGKPPEGTIRLEASHRAGMLLVTITDDGRGIDREQIRQQVVQKKLTTPEIAAQLSEAELMDFLFLPGFSTASKVTEISGRGVGLDAVHTMVHEVGGTVRVTSQPGQGMSMTLQLPLTLSVTRALLVTIAGELYAFPLTRIDQVVTLSRSEICVSENHPFFQRSQQAIGLVFAHQILELPRPVDPLEEFSVVVIRDRQSCYGLICDRILGERKLVVRTLDPRLGKVPNISAAALMEDGSPVLIVDVEDLMQTAKNYFSKGQLNPIQQITQATTEQQQKHILVVDDSITVREMERKLLENHGYKVDVAVNGMDAWNSVRSSHYDLVVTDIDMPRMNGFELVSQIKTSPTLKHIPVIIISYKDREADRLTGLEIGADYYLTKSSFHDDTLVQAVMDLIGK